MFKLVYLLFYKIIIKDELLQKDLMSYMSNVDFDSYKKALRIPGFEFILCFRLATRKEKFTFLGGLSRLRYKSLFVKYGFQIPRATTIGGGLVMIHFGGIVVNQNSIIGSNCTLSHNCTIGHIKEGKGRGAPRIGNRVWIGPGAVIVGGITIGDESKVAANAFVNFDVPPKSLVLGNPGRIIYSK